MNYKQLSQVSKWCTDRISAEKVNHSNYISTENMLPDRGGVEDASTLPDARILSKYTNGDILLSNIRPYFKKVWFANKTGGCSNDVLVVRPDGINAKFLYYVLSDNNFFSYSTVTSKGTKMPRGSKTAIMKYLVPDVDERIQTRIADILSAYDDAIENNNRRIALLEKAARELYREWFERFRFPGHENARFVNGLPEGWEVKRLGIMTNITSSKRIYLSDYVDEGIPFYRSKEIIQLANGEALTEPLFISVYKYYELKDKFGEPCENDILITSVGTIGVSFLVDNRVFYFKDGNLTWLQTGTNPELALYIYLWIMSDMGQGALLSATIGTSQSALTIENLKKLKLIKPADTVLSAFHEMSMSLIEQKRILQTQSQKLARQRDWLLPRLMSEKIALVFDTNFIVSYGSKFEDVYKKLSITYNLYVSEVSIKERLSQNYLELKEKYEKIEKCRIDYANLVDVNIKNTLDEKFEKQEKGIQKKYKDVFGDKIINFISHEDTLNKLMERAFRKIPPFNTADKASDKGFKDTLIWLSLLEYFDKNGENHIIFVTNDKVFHNNAIILSEEFKENTFKTIEIKENSLFETMFKQENEIIEPIKAIPNITLLRDKIQETINKIIYTIDGYDSWGEPEWSLTFTLSKYFSQERIEDAIGCLHKIIDENIFEQSLPANKIFKYSFVKNICSIPMDALQKVLDLYEDINNNYSEYLPQFFSAVTNIINKNYREPESGIINDSDIPF